LTDPAIEAKINRVLDKLSPNEQRALRLRFGLDDGNPKSFKQIGDKMNLNPKTIEELITRTLLKLV
jgi:RNA polymerase primary sigma factor